MRFAKLITALSVTLIPVLAANLFAASAVTPTPTTADKASPTPRQSPTEKVSPTPRPSPTERAGLTPRPSPTEKASPTPKATPFDLAVPSDQPAPAVAAAPPPPAVTPNPVLYLLGVEPYTTGGKNWIRYRYDVANKSSYPAEMFAAAPSLPPCGSNTNSSRTWVDFFDSTGKRLYGFCALGKPDDLGKIWFALEEGVIPPSYVYIELNDRQTSTKYKSNLADTTL